MSPITGAERVREGESFVVANFAAKKSISSDDFFNVPPRLLVERLLLAARLRVAPSEDEDDDETEESDSDEDMAQQDQDCVLEVGDGQL